MRVGRRMLEGFIIQYVEDTYESIKNSGRKDEDFTLFQKWVMRIMAGRSTITFRLGSRALMRRMDYKRVIQGILKNSVSLDLKNE